MQIGNTHYLDQGQACSDTYRYKCAPGLTCVNGTCMPDNDDKYESPCSSHYDCGAGGFFCDFGLGMCREPRHNKPGGPSNDTGGGGGGNGGSGGGNNSGETGSGDARCGDDPPGGEDADCEDQNCQKAASCGDGDDDLPATEKDCCGKQKYKCTYTDDEGNKLPPKEQCTPCKIEKFCMKSECVGGDFARYPSNGHRLVPWRCADGSPVKKTRIDLEPGEASQGCQSPCGCGDVVPVEKPAPEPPVNEGPCSPGEKSFFVDGKEYCGDLKECDQYYHEYYKTYGHFDGTQGTLSDVCYECQDCISYGNLGSSCEDADVDNFDVEFGDHPCHCAAGNEACPYCEHCNATSGECEQRGGQDCVTECNCQFRCANGLTLQGKTTQPYFFDGSRPACASECRAELAKRCAEINDTPDPCERRCQSKFAWIGCADDPFEYIDNNCPDGKICTWTGTQRNYMYDETSGCNENGQIAVFFRICDPLDDRDSKEDREACGGCDCNCFDDCGDCEICGPNGTCIRDPECLNQPCFLSDGSAGGVSNGSGPCNFNCCPTKPWTLCQGSNCTEMDGCRSEKCASYFLTIPNSVWVSAYGRGAESQISFYAIDGTVSWSQFKNFPPAPGLCADIAQWGGPHSNTTCCSGTGYLTNGPGCVRYNCNGCYDVGWYDILVAGGKIGRWWYWPSTSNGPTVDKRNVEDCCLVTWSGSNAEPCPEVQCPSGFRVAN